MRPYNDIKINDVYRTPTGSEWLVMDKDDSEKMVKLIMVSNLPEHLNKPFWKKSTSNIFNNRVKLDFSI